MTLGGFASDDQKIGADGLDEFRGGKAGGAFDAAGDDGDGGDVEFLDEGIQAGFLGGERVRIVPLDVLSRFRENLGEDSEDAEDVNALGLGAGGEVERGLERHAGGGGVIDNDREVAKDGGSAAGIGE